MIPLHSIVDKLYETPPDVSLITPTRTLRFTPNNPTHLVKTANGLTTSNDAPDALATITYDDEAIRVKARTKRIHAARTPTGPHGYDDTTIPEGAEETVLTKDQVWRLLADKRIHDLKRGPTQLTIGDATYGLGHEAAYVLAKTTYLTGITKTDTPSPDAKTQDGLLAYLAKDHDQTEALPGPLSDAIGTDHVNYRRS